MPLRYYHRPRARDDAHGYGKPSRFLSERLQALCDISRPDADSAGENDPQQAAGRRVEVSLDHLFI